MNNKQRQAIQEGRRIIKEGHDAVARLKGSCAVLHKDLLICIWLLCQGLLWLGVPEFVSYLIWDEFVGFGHGFWALYLAQAVYYGMVLSGLGMVLNLLARCLYTLFNCWRTILQVRRTVNLIQRQIDSV